MNRIVLLLLILLLTGSISHAAQFDIDHFNGIKWGVLLPQSGFKLFSKGSDGEKFYSRMIDKSKLEGIPVEELTYTSKAGRFVSAHALFQGENDYQKIRHLCQKIFGNSRENLAGREFFKISQGGKFVTAMLQFSNGRGMVNFNCDRGRR